MRLPSHLINAVIVMTFAFFSAHCLAQEPTGPIAVMIHPAAAPRPLLKHRLTTEFVDRLPGNAAVYYGKVTAEQAPFFNRPVRRDNVDRWQKSTLEELRNENARVGFPRMFVRQAIRCGYCDWQLPLASNFDGFLLPEVQQTRQFARYMAAEARIAVAHGEYDDAIELMRLNYGMARQVGEGETLINGLVGIAICHVTNLQMRELIQQPDAPNLYWALSILPTPTIDFRDAVEAEASAFFMALPELRDPAGRGRSAEQWLATLADFSRGLHEGNDDSYEPPPRDQLTAQCELARPEAEKKLVARGWAAEELVELPTAQVILIDSMDRFRAMSDEAVTAFLLPFPESIRRLDAIGPYDNISDQPEDELLPMAWWSIPGIKSCRRASARIDREFAALRVLEALRIYAAAHDGALPPSLDVVTEVVIPRDPATDGPFEYELSDGVARLTSPAIDSTGPLEYEITMAAAE